jgi:hypothetical protein
MDRADAFRRSVRKRPAYPRSVSLAVSLLTSLLFLTLPLRAATFNVTAYGAVGDDSTDNTEAFSACLKAVIAAGGGKMFIPDGIYRGRIVIPGTKAWITVEIAGESEPTPVWGTIGTFVFPKNGTIIKCLSESGPAVISSANVPDKLYMQFSGVTT